MLVVVKCHIVANISSWIKATDLGGWENDSHELFTTGYVRYSSCSRGLTGTPVGTWPSLDLYRIIACI